MAAAGGWQAPSDGATRLLEALRARDGRRAVLVFEASDTQAVGRALRTGGAEAEQIWEATLHTPETSDASETDRSDAASRQQVVVERSFERPAAFAELQAREDGGAWCLDLHGVRFQRTYFSLDRRRMLCVYEAPDAESVRTAQRTIAMPVARVWSARAAD